MATHRVRMDLNIEQRDGLAVISTEGLGEIGSCDRKAFLGTIAEEFGVVITAAAGTVDPTDKVLDEVYIERGNQDTKWGQQDHENGTSPVLAMVAQIARKRCQRAAEAGKVTWRHILEEEVAEANAEPNPVKLRAELVQVAAVAVAWIEAIDRTLTTTTEPPPAAEGGEKA
jgi:hypothetical protein